eukprot:7315528-Ditylum_brightwellii.AAC.1
MVLVLLAHWADSINSEWWLDKTYHPLMKDIIIDMALKSVMVAQEVIEYVHRGVYDVALLSNADNTEFNKMNLYTTQKYGVKKHRERNKTPHTKSRDLR